ncbi:MAG: hypothetical protein IBJ11_07245 [Phycisphaerales bacterium]|nr:hypothetical protein [Phycisphaerales bacterium]
MNVRTRFGAWAVVGAVWLGSASMALGQSVVVPPAFAGAAGNFAPATLTLAAPDSRTLSWVYSSGLLSGIPVGSRIWGIAFRQSSGGADAPAAARTFPRYDIEIAASLNAPSVFSATFANNTAPDAVTVRSGALTIPAGFFPGGAVPNDFSAPIVFTEPYVYGGTDLVITVRLQGGSGGSIVTLDSLTTGAAGFGSTVQFTWANSDTAAAGTVTGGASGAPITKIFFTPPQPESFVYGPRPLADTDANNFWGASGPLADGPFTAQVVVGPSELGAVPPGSEVVGLSYRMNVGQAAWPPAAVNFAQYDIRLSTSVNPPGSLSATFNSNEGADARLVRSGALPLTAGFVPAATAPAGFWSPPIGFGAPFVYKGGSLLTTIRHSGNGATFARLDSFTNASMAGRAQGIYNTLSNVAASANLTNGMTPVRFQVRPAIMALDGTVATPGNGGGSPGGWTGLTDDGGTAQQLIIAAAQLKGIPPGSTITGMSMRARTPQAAFPAGGDAYFGRFDVTMATATNPPPSASTTFASNMGADAKAVRSGPLTVAAGAYSTTLPAGSAVPDFGPVISFFDPFVYTGGDLAILVRHGGWNRADGLVDAVQGQVLPNGLLYRFIVSGNADAASGTADFFNVPIIRLHFTPSQVISAARADVNAGGSTSLPLGINATTYQIVLSGTELGAQSIRPGTLLNGMAFRANQAAAGLAADTSFAQYDVSLASSPNGPASMSTTFASNISAGTEVVVRSGPLSVPALQLPTLGLATAANPPVYFIRFDRPFRYAGGDLTLTIRHSGAGASILPLDAAFSAGDGRGTAFQAVSASGVAAAVGTLQPPAMLRFGFTLPAYCVGDVDRNGSTAANDLTRVLVAFGKSVGQPGYDVDADIDGNGTVAANDLTLLLVDFGCVTGS